MELETGCHCCRQDLIVNYQTFIVKGRGYATPDDRTLASGFIRRRPFTRR